MIIESDIESSKKKQKTKKVDEYGGENDLRYIIKEGKKEKLSAYESLKSAGYIKAPQENLLKIGWYYDNVFFFPTPYKDELLYSI